MPKNPIIALKELKDASLIQNIKFDPKNKSGLLTYRATVLVGERLVKMEYI